MENKGIIRFFALFLGLSCLYQLSFTYFVQRFEQRAFAHASGVFSDQLQQNPTLDSAVLFQLKDQYIRENANSPIYPVFGFTYAECKDKEINLGLDLQGGMSVSLQVSSEALLRQLVANPTSDIFLQDMQQTLQRTQTQNENFLDIFVATHRELHPNVPLIDLFYSYNNKEKFAAELTDDEVLQVLKKEAAKALDGTEQVLRSRIDQFGVAQPTLQKQALLGRIHLELPGVKDKQRVRKLLQATANLEFYEALEAGEFARSLYEIDQLLSQQIAPNYRDSVDQVYQKLQNQKPAQKSQEDLAQLDEDIEKSLEPVDQAKAFAQSVDQSRYSPLLSKLQINQRGPVMGYVKAIDTAAVSALLSRPTVRGFLPKNTDFFWDSKSFMHEREGYVGLYLILKEKGQALLDGKSLTQAGVVLDPMTGKPAISMTMNAVGRKIWKDVTTKKLNKYIAITLDNHVLSAPVISSVIPDGRSQITGSFSYEEAQDLVNILQAGSLPVASKITAENYVGPSLGEENIRASVLSFMIAIGLVLFYMVFYYASAGWFANFALFFNLFLLLGFLVTLQATMNLPSIAGLILTIGMAVDANVLVFERIREELRQQSSDVLLAIRQGYSNAIWSILDANITTVLTGVALLVFGMGAIKGFALTLLIGIGTSFFSGIFVTRWLLESWISGKRNIAFSTSITKNWFTNIYIQFVERRKFFYLLSSAVIVLGLGSLLMNGLNYGIDFAGGRKFKVNFSQPLKENDIRAALVAAFVEDGKSAGAEVKKVEDNQHFFIMTKYLIHQTGADVDQKVEQALVQGLSSLIAPEHIEIESMFLVDSSVSSEMKTSSITAILVSLLAIFVYIALRFQRWQYGLGAIIALAHDVLIVLSVFSLGYSFVPFSLEIDQNLIAALLTVVGYSINDTVVVFDRIREYNVFGATPVSAGLLNKALSSTISRTINTSLTTLLVLLVILIFGGESIKGFVFAMTIGVVVGTYSSLFIAAPVVYDAQKK